MSQRGGGGSNDEGRKEGRKRLLRWVGTAFTGLYLVHKFPFDPAGDGFPSVGLWMSRDRGVIRFPFVCCPPFFSPLFLFPPPPSQLLLCRAFLDRKGHFCVIVMQHSSAAWDDVNETAFSNEKLLWHVLKDKAPTVWRVRPKFSARFSPCCFGILFLTLAELFFFFSFN